MVIKRGEVIYRQAGALLAGDLEDLVEQAKSYDPDQNADQNANQAADQTAEQSKE